MKSKVSLKIEVTDIYLKNLEAQKPVVVNIGGARSSKSYSVAQLLIQKLITENNKTFGITRKTFPALRMTAYKLFIELLQRYQIYKPDNHNKTEHTYRFGSNVVYFFSLDDPEKIKSTEFNYLWIEEANEFTYEDYIVLKLRLSAPPSVDTQNRIYLSLNPIDGNNWIAKDLIRQPDVDVIKSTYKDNPFLSEEYIQFLLQLRGEDENYWKVYGLGEWGQLENLIYTRWKIDDGNIPKHYAMAYGLDFGYIAPTALIKVYMCDDGIYLDERLYKEKMTNAGLIEFLSHEERGDIYADSAEPARIEEIYRAGYNIYPAQKDVQLGIDLCRRQTLNITTGSNNLIKEIRGYRRKVDKNGNVLEEPVKFNDHLMDAMRYAVYGMTTVYGFPTAKPKKNLGFPVWSY